MRSFKSRLAVLMICSLLLTNFGENWWSLDGGSRRAMAAEAIEDRPEYLGELQLGQLEEITLGTKEDEIREAIYKFVAPETDTYIFYSLSDFATAAVLYNRAGTTILQRDNGSGTKGNFALRRQLDEGEVCYLGAGFALSATESGSFLIGVKKAINSSVFAGSQVLSEKENGRECNISALGEAVYYQFSPSVSGTYNIYTKDFCGGECTQGVDASCSSCGECDCLKDLKINVYIQDGQGEMERLYYSDSAEDTKSFLVHAPFEAAQKYYLEITSSDEQHIGRFKLCISSDISDVPMSTLPMGESVERIINDSTESIFYRIVPEESGTHEFTSESGDGLYMTLYDQSMTVVHESSQYANGTYVNDFQDKVALEQGKTYYLQLSTSSLSAYSFQVKVEFVTQQVEPEPTPEASGAPGGNTTEGGTAENSPEPSPGDGGQISQISMDEVEIETIANQSYTGKMVRPAVQISYSSEVLVKDTDYTVTYKNNKKIGVASVQINGTGRFTGSRTMEFKIVPGKPVIKSGKRTGRKLSLNWKKVKGAAGYEVCYAYSSKFKKSKTMKLKKCKTVLKLTSEKNCYVRVRAYKKVKKKTYNSSWSAKKKY